jgi:RNA polymerase sigma-70 factor (ECF subfamily)
VEVPNSIARIAERYNRGHRQMRGSTEGPADPMRPPPRPTPDVTLELPKWLQAGPRIALDRLMTVLEADLKRLAASYMRRERPDHTLQGTALVGEVYLRLAGQDEVVWKNRNHFLGIAASCMRRILVDHARRRGAKKRPRTRIDIETLALQGVSTLDQVLHVHAALEALAARHPRAARVIELKVFAGLTIDEIAEVEGIAPATVKRAIAAAKTYLKTLLSVP